MQEYDLGYLEKSSLENQNDFLDHDEHCSLENRSDFLGHGSLKKAADIEDHRILIVSNPIFYQNIVEYGSAILMLMCIITMIVYGTVDNGDKKCLNVSFEYSLFEVLLLAIMPTVGFGIYTHVSNIIRDKKCLPYDLAYKWLVSTFVIFLIIFWISCLELFFLVYFDFATCNQYPYFQYLLFLSIFQIALSSFLLGSNIYTFVNVEKVEEILTETSALI